MCFGSPIFKLKGQVRDKFVLGAGGWYSIFIFTKSSDRLKMIDERLGCPWSNTKKLVGV